MAFDVFISYPHQDKATADAACAALEAKGVRCWIAPRDVAPGADWAESIVEAVDRCRVMVLIFSASANGSRQIQREIQQAFDHEVPVIPFRIENVAPAKALAYYMGPVHWLDALTPPLENHLLQLARSIQALLLTKAADNEREEPDRAAQQSQAEEQERADARRRAEDADAERRAEERRARAQEEELAQQERAAALRKSQEQQKVHDTKARPNTEAPRATARHLDDGVIAKPSAARWGQLVLGVICMMAITNLQYGWTYFLNPISTKYAWTLSSTYASFTIFILAETWLAPFTGYLVDKFGPRTMLCAGGVLIALGWSLSSIASSLLLLYLATAITGVGAGTIYGGCIGNTMKWFADHRGLAVGLVAAAFGIAAALTLAPIPLLIASKGYESTMLWFGLGQGVVVIAASLGLRAPRSDEMTIANTPGAPQTSRAYTLAQVAETGAFWVMYAIFAMVSLGALLVFTELPLIARTAGISGTTQLFTQTMQTLAFAFALGRISAAASAPLMGALSDRIGRENTMALTFALGACAIVALYVFVAFSVAFVVLSGLVYFAWGAIYSLFPALCTDLYGRRFVTTNYGLLYTAKGLASLLITVGATVYAITNNWTFVIILAVILHLAAAVMALLVLKPLSHRQLTRG